MDVPDYVEQLRRDGKRLATVASFTDPGAPLTTPTGRFAIWFITLGRASMGDRVRPGCRTPAAGWRPRAIRRRVARGHRAGGVVRGRPPSARGGARVGSSRPGDVDVPRGSHAAHLLGAPPGRETAIHRVDAERACGDVTGSRPASRWTASMSSCSASRTGPADNAGGRDDAVDGRARG